MSTLSLEACGFCWYMKPLFEKEKARPSFRLASVHTVTSVSRSDQDPSSRIQIPIALGIVSANQCRSECTVAFKKILADGRVLPTVFLYSSESAGQPQGNTLSTQLRCPAKHCHSRRGCYREDIERKESILMTMILTESGDRVIVPLLISTQNPIIFK